METINKLAKKAKLKVLGDPAKCIVTFKIKVAILNIIAIYIIIKIISWLVN